MGNKIPASWFDDDPEWEMLRRKAANRPVPKELRKKIAAARPRIETDRDMPRAKADKEVTDKEVVFNLKLAIPRIRIPNLRRVYQHHSRLARIIVISVAIGVLGVVSFKLIFRRDTSAVQGVSSSDGQQASFSPLIPLDAESGSQEQPEVTYDRQRQVITYGTEYNGAILTINQQALPENFKTNPGELEYVAKSIGAYESMDTQKGKAYIVTNEKNRTQRVVFTYRDVLVFVQANKSLDDEEWEYYINQLSPPIKH